MTTPTADPPHELQFALPGASPGQIGAAVAAARRSLAAAGVDPAEAFRAYAARAAWRRCEGPALTAAEDRLAMIFAVAQVAAIAASIGLRSGRPKGMRLFFGPRLSSG